MAIEDTIRRIGEAINAHDLDAYAEHWAPDVVVHSPAHPEPLRGRQAVRDDMESFLTAFPDVQGETLNVITKGDTVAVQSVFKGTNTGPMMGLQGTIPLTNRGMELRAASFLRVDDEGQVVEEHRYFDIMGMAMQLGLAPGS